MSKGLRERVLFYPPERSGSHPGYPTNPKPSRGQLRFCTTCFGYHCLEVSAQNAQPPLPTEPGPVGLEYRLKSYESRQSESEFEGFVLWDFSPLRHLQGISRPPASSLTTHTHLHIVFKSQEILTIGAVSASHFGGERPCPLQN